MKAAIEAGWTCRVCGDVRVFRADKGGLVTDTGYAIWQAENQLHVRGHLVAQIVSGIINGGSQHD